VLVAPEDLLRVPAHGGEKDDRQVARALGLLDQRGGLKAIHPVHLDVQQNERELVMEQMA
jgi:hypothetical protein